MATRELTPQDFKSLLEFSKNLARSAGALIREGAKAIQHNKDQSANVDEKKNSVDLVTQWDVRVEEHVKSEIQKAWPEFGLWADFCWLGISALMFSDIIFKYRWRIILKFF